MTEFLETMLAPLESLYQQFKSFLPGLVAMLLILAGGILLARLIELLLVRVLTALKFDSWSDRMGFTNLMRKGDLWSRPSVIIGGLVFWLLTLVTLMLSLGALRVAAIDQMVSQFFGYLPRVFAAAIVLAVGYVLSGFASRAVLIAASNSGFHYARFLAKAVATLLTVLILAMVMEQLQIAPGIVLAAFSIVFGGIVTALAIAFGVGGIDAARRIIERETADTHGNTARDDIEHL